ncbi:MAG: hypothetical protein MH321_15700 [Leptospiraceae bacterium]|nr:hypothetical protein [Leptospiraceae bacterium]
MKSRVLLYFFSLYFLYKDFLTERFWWKTFGNADYLFPYSYFKSLNSIHDLIDWNFPPSNYIFPDLILSGISFLILSFLHILRPEFHFILTIFLFQISIATLIAKLSNLGIYDNNVKRFQKTFFYSLTALTILNLSVLILEFNLDQVLFTNHSGVIILILLCLVAIRSYNLSLLSLTIFLGSLSDSMFCSLIIIFLWISNAFPTYENSINYSSERPSPSKNKPIPFLNRYKFRIGFTSIALLGYSTSILFNHFGIITSSHTYYTQYFSIDRFNFKHLDSVVNLFLSILANYWLYFLVLIFFSTRKIENKLFPSKSLSQIGFINLFISIAYISFSRYFSLRYLPLLQFILIWKIAVSKWRVFYFILSLVFSIFIYWKQSSSQDVSSIQNLPFLRSLGEIHLAYPDSTLCLDYWKARPVAVYSRTIPDDFIQACDSNGVPMYWIDKKKRRNKGSLITIRF